MALLMEHTGLDLNVLVDYRDLREAMARRFSWDPALRESYVANVAMLIHDRYGITEYKLRNAIANDIIALIFES